jgi:flagellar biosynthesis protein FlhF
MLVNSRKSAIETRHLGTYEVVFVTEVPPDPEAPAETALATPASDRLSQQMADFKRELEGLRRTINRSAMSPANLPNASVNGTDGYNILTGNEVLPELAREIIDAAELRVNRPGTLKLRALERVAFRNALVAELESRIQVQPVLGRGDKRPRMVALVGPPGCGKTTTLVKLAVNYGLAARRPVMLLSMDNYRVAAAEQLRSYAAILGVGFQVLETVAALAQSIEEHRGKELIFIDTPGLGPAEIANYAPLAQFLSTRDDIDTQITLSCSMKSADLSRVVDSFAVFRPQRLIFTKQDETGSFGPVLNEIVRTGKPLSFLTNGQRIPEDLEAATKSRVAELILSGNASGQALSVA